MEQFVLNPQHLYEQKCNLKVKNLDTFAQKPVSVPTHFNPNYKEINARTGVSKNESIVDQILSSPRVKLSLTDTILLDGRDAEVAFADFIYALKRKNDIYYSILDATGINPQKVINKDAKGKTEGAGFLSKSEEVKLQRLYGDGKAAYGSINKIYKSQVGYPKRKLPTFCRVRILIQSIFMQHDISKDYQHLLSESMRTGVSICLLWMNY